MKRTKKCENTQNKISKTIKNLVTKKKCNRRYYSAGPFNTSSAGAIMLLIGSIILCALCSNVFTNSNTYADSITMSIDTNKLQLDLAPTSTAGSFSSSSSANISVTTDYAAGYTLSIASPTGNTNLTNGGNSISSISSAISESTFSDSANTSYNNKWGYRPSKYYNASTEQTITNTDFRPLPGSSGEILDKTSAPNSTANTYTLSIGARANSSTAIGNYSNDSFVITAIANIVPLTIIYDANGGYFGSSQSTTTNTVKYDATSESSTETVTKYSHTSNINDQGVASGTYPASQATKDVVTIPGATQLNVQIYYATRSSSYAAAYAFTGVYTGSISSSTTGYLKKYTSGQGTTKETANTDTFTVTGDTVTFGFYSSSRSSRYYGYYAIVTAEVDSTTYSKTAISGSYATPNNSDLSFAGWTESQSGSGTVYADESEVSTELPYVNGDPAVTLYAKWKIPTLYDLVAKQSKGKQSVSDLQAAITKSNSGVYEYDDSSSVFGPATDASSDYSIYYYRGILDNTTGTYGSDGDNEAYPNTVVLSTASSKSGLTTSNTCWRIVRTTGSGGTKMIYQGKWTGSTCANATTSAQTAEKAFDATAASNGKSIVGVGYTYNSSYKSTATSTQAGTLFGTNSSYSGNTTNSTIKSYLEGTGSSNFWDTISSYESKLEPSAGYCNDRSVNSGDTWTTYSDSTSITTPYTSGSSATLFRFGARQRNQSTYQTITLGCPRSTVDLYTTSSASNGNKQLGKPVALLTADEASFAGSGSPTASQGSSYNANSYLRSGSIFWSLSPHFRDSSGYAYGLGLSSYGYLAGSGVERAYGVRPVISLTSGTTAVSGTGTATDPWIVNP